MEIYCPLKYLAGHAGLCNPDCALFDPTKEACLIALALEHYIGTEEEKEENIQPQSMFPNDDWGNPTSGWETWKINGVRTR